MFKYGTMDRRNCLRTIGMLGCGLLASPLLFAQPARAGLESSLKKTQKTLPLMGTLVSITILDSSQDKACQAQEEAFSRMQQLVPFFDRHTANTPISHLNHSGQLRDVSFELQKVMRKARDYYNLSKGSFDITVLPLLKRNQRRYSSSADSVKQRAETGKPAVGFEHVQFSSKNIRFLKEEMQISLDGIAKGYIVDQAIYSLKEQGIDYALVEAGGDIRAIGSKKEQKTWKIGITDPWKQDNFVQLLELDNAAVATSGNYKKFFDQAKQHHHLIDTQTGDSPGHTVSCSVLAPTAMEADALSTALFIKPVQQSLALANSLFNVETSIITPQGKTFASQGWGKFSGKS